jgi:hypothetical protein
LLKIKLIFLFLISFTFLGFSRAQAQAVQNDASSPIETRAVSGFIGLIGGGMEYHLNGQKIDRYQDFKNLIYPLHDPEASNLIRTAEETDFASWMVFATGAAISADAALVYKPTVVFSVDWLDRVTTAFLTFDLALGAFTIVHNIAEGQKFNAVQRYNRVIHDQTRESSLELNPKIYACSNGLVLGGELAF